MGWGCRGRGMCLSYCSIVWADCAQVLGVGPVQLDRHFYGVSSCN